MVDDQTTLARIGRLRSPVRAGARQRARAQQTQLVRLWEGLDGLSCTTLPFLFGGELERSDIEQLSRRLEGSLQ